MSEIEDVAQEALESESDSRMHSLVAVLVAITATVMAVGNIKDGNIVQAMAQSQARAVDTWALYQAKSTKQHLAENTAEQIRLRIETEPGLSADARGRLEVAVARYQAQSARYDAEKAKIKADAEHFEAEYDRLNQHDDQFDMAEACLTISMALYGIAALTRKRWLLGGAIVLTGLGIFLTASGFLGWSFHPDWLAKLLG